MLIGKQQKCNGSEYLMRCDFRVRIFRMVIMCGVRTEILITWRYQRYNNNHLRHWLCVQGFSGVTPTNLTFNANEFFASIALTCLTSYLVQMVSIRRSRFRLFPPFAPADLQAAIQLEICGSDYVCKLRNRFARSSNWPFSFVTHVYINPFTGFSHFISIDVFCTYNAKYFFYR